MTARATARKVHSMDPIGPKVHSMDLPIEQLPIGVHQLDLALRLLNESIEESGLKDGYIAQCLEVDPAYFSKMRKGTKPWSLGHLVRLPAEVQNIFKPKYAQTCPGVLVVTPIDQAEACRQLATGLVNLLAPFARVNRWRRQAKAGL